MNTLASASLRGVTSAATIDRPSTQVESQISEINRELERFDKALAEHATKLQSVLRQEAEVCKPECSPPEEILVPSADQLRTICKRMTRQREIIAGFMEKYEV